MARKILIICRDVLIIAITTVAFLEAALRIYNTFHPLPVFYASSYNRYRGKPFSAAFDFHLNSKGFKDVEYNIQKTAGTYRILGIGDSFAFGVVPYANNYLTLVEAGLNKAGKRVEVINMGIPGTGPRDYLALVVSEGLELDPNMVLVSFFIGNDFDDQKENRDRRLYTYSYVATIVKFLADVQTKFEGTIYSAAYDDDAPNFSDEEHVKIEHERSRIFLKNNTSLATDLPAALSHLIKLKEICDRRKIRFAIVVIPDEVQINTSLRQKIMTRFELGPESFDFARPNKLLDAKLRELNVDYLDLLDKFLIVSEGTRLYKPRDTHWNIKGNELASQLIIEHLMAQ